MSIKASELIRMLAEHIGKYGDGNVLIYDDYESIYKTFDWSSVSRKNDRFVIECHQDD